MKSYRQKEESINSIKKYFILLQDTVACKKTDIAFLSKYASISVTKGTLWFTTCDHASRDHITLYLVDNPDISLAYNQEYIRPLDHTEYLFLLAISNNWDRYFLYNSENDILKKAVDLVKSQRDKSGNIEVKVRCENSNRFLLGILLGIQNIDGKPGLWLKIGFKNNKGKSSEKFETLPLIKEFILKKSETPKQMLNEGDRVVWISDRDVPEYGTVRWCGILGEHSNQYSYGVELDNPVGSGTGQLDGKQLFKTRMNHASFIPALGLIRAEEFDSTEVSLNSCTSERRDSNIKGRSVFSEHENVDLIQDCSPFSTSLRYVDFPESDLKSKKKDLSHPTRFEGKSDYASYDNMASISKESKIRNKSKGKSPSKYDSEISIGSVVQVDIPGLTKSQYGTVRWKGCASNEAILGIELEEPCSAATDGRFDNEQKFTCAPKKGYFVKLSKVKRDDRPKELCPEREFGDVECPEIAKAQGCFFANSESDLSELLKRKMDEQFISKSASHPKIDHEVEIGRNLGIQGYYNSCYMDVTLFSMFAFNHGFDFILHRRKTSRDTLLYNEIQSVLCNEIVNPLRSNLYVRADKILKLRQLIDRTSSKSGFLTEGKDPEEFLQCLFLETLRAEPFIKFRSGTSEHFFQLLVNGNDGNDFTTTQELLKSYLLRLNLSFSETPSSLILQLPRCGQVKVFNSIMPSLYINLGTIQRAALCFLCKNRSCFMCNDCRQELNGKPLEFCRNCSKEYHLNLQRKLHQPYYIGEHEVYDQYCEMLELFSVICIKTSHYVCFTKCGLLADSPWVFFDSMSDRSERNGGYNIPRITPCPHVLKYLYDPHEFERLIPNKLEELPEEVIRFMCDGYICMYRSIDLLNYR